MSGVRRERGRRREEEEEKFQRVEIELECEGARERGEREGRERKGIEESIEVCEKVLACMQSNHSQDQI